MRALTPSRVFVLAAVLMIGPAPPVAAQSTDDLYAPDALQEIHLTINRLDLERLQETYKENTFYSANFQWGDVKVRNVGVRSRGSFSRSSSKPGLQVEFDYYVGAQRFLGLRTLVLDNMWQDPSMIHERLSMAFFARMGEAAPRVTFCRLYINDTYFGLYAVVEAVNKDFLGRTRENNDGYVFEYKHRGAYFFGDLGEELEPYKAIFEPRTHHLDPDAVLYGPIRDLVHEINAPEDSVWRERVEQRIDLTQFVTHVAIETYLAEADGIIGGSGMANFYLARDTPSGQHRIIPWDKDLTFSDVEFPIFLRADQNVLLQRALRIEDLRKKYLDVLEACVESARDWLLPEINRLTDLIADARAEDPRRPYSDEAFSDAIDGLKRFARVRAAFLLPEIAEARH
jgi:spore coat protein CotH